MLCLCCEIMHSLSAGPALRNDVIALFHDGEEYGTFAGTRAFVREHPWMKNVLSWLGTGVDGQISPLLDLCHS